MVSRRSWRAVQALIEDTPAGKMYYMLRPTPCTGGWPAGRGLSIAAPHPEDTRNIPSASTRRHQCLHMSRLQGRTTKEQHTKLAQWQFGRSRGSQVQVKLHQSD